MKKIKKIKDSFIARQISTARLSIKTARGYLKARKSDDFKDVLKGTFSDNIDFIVNELDLMKGSLMKAGQMLSLFGGAFLPEELQKIIKKLENQTSYLEWDEIKKQIPKDWLNQIQINETPLASASLGQVHIIDYKGQKYCMKIQYKGVRKAINNDIRSLKLLLKMFNFIPSELRMDDIFNEIKAMLVLETDYQAEAQNTKEFKELLANYENYTVPRLLDKFSNDRIITTEFLAGNSLHDIDTLGFSQEDRNRLGREFMRLFLLEVFVFEKVQTDAHFGNYLLLKKPKPHWGLIDFGATKHPPQKFVRYYQKLILSLKDKNRDDFLDLVFKLGYLSSTKESDTDLFWEYAQLIGSPFIDDEYDWGNSDVAERVMDYIPKIIKSVSVGNPPPDSLFIDRKLGGVFFILQQLKARFNVNQILDDVLREKADN